jgi:acetylornithine/N-succinyldiaminopimelate aminotransferase
MLARENIAKSFVPGTHGTTFGGNPLACAVACKSFECVNRPEFLADVKVKEKIFKDKLTALNAKYDCFVDIRGLGLLIGAQLKDATKLMEFKAICMQEGVFVLTAGNDVVRMVPALNISIEEIEEGFARVEKAAAKLFA